MTPKLKDEECEVARLPRNRERNRYMDVLPSDRLMPYLVTPHPTDPDSNYINAIFTDSYAKRNAFIVTQTPLPNTVIDFWRLVYDYNCTSVIMMDDLGGQEPTCCQYWPDNGTAVFGSFTVELSQIEDEVDFTTRILKIQNMNRPNEAPRMVKQFQLTNWPENQPVPYTRNAVLRVIQLVTKWQTENNTPIASTKDEGRMLVHCLAGAGRSGTFVACYNMCMQLRQEFAVDVFNIVQRLRNIRPQLVETLEQYRFCYEVGWDFADQ
nr:receptor-type tyrosine-protein phosphatase mu-like [Styela clava]